MGLFAALTVTVASVGIWLGSTFAAEPDFIAEQPNRYKVIEKGSSETIKISGALKANSWLSPNSGVATVTNSGVVSGKGAGEVVIVASDSAGNLSAYPRQITDATQISSYTLKNREFTLKKSNTATVEFVSITPSNGGSTISWSSLNESVASINASSGEITAIGNGLATIQGNFKDKFGVKQTISIAVSVGQTGITVIGPVTDPRTGEEEYYKETGTEHVYEEVDENGESKNPPKYIYDPDDSLKNNPPRLNVDEKELTVITDDMKTTVPSAEEFDNTAPGYLTDDEKEAYEKSIEKVEAEGVEKGSNGNYYQKVPETDDIWQEVEFGKDGSITKKNPESLVAGTTTSPNPCIPLEEITDGMKTTIPSADGFDETHEGYLTPREKEKYEDAIKKGVEAGIKDGDDGKYYQKVEGEDKIWQEVEFDANGNMHTVEPEHYVGGTAKYPDSDMTLYKIREEDNKDTPPAVDYSKTYMPNYLTNDGDGSEYEQWLEAKGGANIVDKDGNPITGIQTDVGKTFTADGWTWQVIGVDANGNMLITTTELVAIGAFNNPASLGTKYKGSMLEAKIKAFYLTLGELKTLAQPVNIKTETLASAPVADGMSEVSISGEKTAFALSRAEVNVYFESDTARACKYSGKANYYWLRSAGSSANVSTVHTGGVICNSCVGVKLQESHGVRPALWIHL